MKIRGDKSKLRQGVSIIYVAVTAIAVVGLTSFAVDFGKVQLAKTQLQNAADAAARAGVSRISSVTDAQNYAIQFAAANNVDGTPVALNVNSDIEFGIWDKSTRVFTVVTGPARASATALRITARRTTARGNAIGLIFAKAFGRNTCDINASSTAYVDNRFFGVVGLDSVKITGTGSSKMDSYDSLEAAYSGSSARAQAAIATNGDVQLGGNIVIKGDAHPGMGRSVAITGAASVTGSTTPLNFPLNYSAPVAGDCAGNNNNSSVPGTYLSAGNFNLNTNLTLPGGNYYFDSFTVGTGGNLRFTGPAVIYVNGNISMQGIVTPSGSSPTNLRMRVVAAGTTVTLKSAADFYADVYCPLSDVNISGSSDYFGGYVGKTLVMAGSASYHYDEALGAAGIYGNGISIVK